LQIQGATPQNLPLLYHNSPQKARADGEKTAFSDIFGEKPATGPKRGETQKITHKIRLRKQGTFHKNHSVAKYLQTQSGNLLTT
jgi:hypothetical protein